MVNVMGTSATVVVCERWDGMGTTKKTAGGKNLEIHLTVRRETVGTGTRCLTSGRYTVGTEAKDGKGSGNRGRERNALGIPAPVPATFLDPIITARTLAIK